MVSETSELSATAATNALKVLRVGGFRVSSYFTTGIEESWRVEGNITWKLESELLDPEP